MNGTMASSSDTDFYRVSVAAGGTLSSTLTPNSSSDYDLHVFNSAGTRVAAAPRHRPGGLGRRGQQRRAAAAYFVRVRFFRGGTGATGGEYTLQLD